METSSAGDHKCHDGGTRCSSHNAHWRWKIFDVPAASDAESRIHSRRFPSHLLDARPNLGIAAAQWRRRRHVGLLVHQGTRGGMFSLEEEQ